MTFTTIAQIEVAPTVELIAFYNSINTDKPVKKFADRATAIKRCSALIVEPEAVEQVAVEAKAQDVAEVAPNTNEAKGDDESNEAKDGENKFVWPFKPVGEIGVKKTAEKAEKQPVTKAQAAILRKIALSLYTSLNGSEPATVEQIGWVWSNVELDSTAAQKTAAALVELGMVEFNGNHGEDACVTLTQLGFDTYKALPEGYGVVTEKPKKPISNASNAAGVADSWNDERIRKARLTRHEVDVEVNGEKAHFKSFAEAFKHYRLMLWKYIPLRLKAKEAGVGNSVEYIENGITYKFAIAEKVEAK